MDPDTGGPSSGTKSPETIVSITNHFARGGFFQSSHYYCLIITDRKIICVKTNDLLVARRKDAMERKIAVRGGPLGFLMMALSLDWADVDFSEYFSRMHPDDILAAHPDAEIIRLSNLTSFVVTKGFFFAVSERPPPCWDTQITGSSKSGIKTIGLSTGKYPDKILDNNALKTLLGKKYEFIDPGIFEQMFGSSRGF